MAQKFILKVLRGEPGNQYWEEFEQELHRGTNVISALMEIRKNPVNREGKKVAPVVWEDGCLEEVCGSCAMLVNGKPQQACSALIETIIKETRNTTITLAPFSKFPLIRDLMIDRSSMFENLKKVHGWVDAESFRRGSGPPIGQEKQEIMYTISTCMSCGCCAESCPQFHEKSSFIGPAPIAQVRLFNAHPTGKLNKKTRLHALMEVGGVSDCGNAQNCARVCPKNIPLTEAIASIGRDVTIQSFKDLFSFADRD